MEPSTEATEPAEETMQEITMVETVSGEAMGAAIIASGKCGSYVRWTLDGKGELVISGTGPMDDNTGSWSSYRDSIISVEIEDGVTRIGETAFYGCSNLTSVTIGDDVTSIGSGAFQYCFSLTSIELPDNLTSIGFDAFRFCESLTSIAIKDKVTSIYYSFTNCNNIAEIFYGGTQRQWSSLGKPRRSRQQRSSMYPGRQPWQWICN